MQFYQTNLLNYFTTKKDGNLAFHVDDDIDYVINRHIKLAKKLNYNYKNLIYMKQIHSNIVHVVKESDDFFTPQNCDAIISNRRNTPLMVMVADCTPLLMYDDKNRVIAAVHAGRAGAFKNIVKNVIDSFTTNFQSNTKNISVTIGANIKECCYEVGYEIYHEAKELDLEYAITHKNNKYFLNINSILVSQLLENGIMNENIKISKECTSCLDNKYFSYRKQKYTGRFAGIISLT